MPARIPPIEPGAASEETVDELLREASEGWYEDAAFFGAMAHQPTIFRRLVDVLAAFPQHETLDTQLLELVRLRIARVHACAYCATVRTSAVREDVAPREAAVLGDDIDEEQLSRPEALAVRLADLLSRDPHRISDSFFAELREEFGDEALVELLLFCSLEVGLDRFTIALELDTTGEGPYPSGLEYPLSDPEPRDGG